MPIDAFLEEACHERFIDDDDLLAVSAPISSARHRTPSAERNPQRSEVVWTHAVERRIVAQRLAYLPLPSTSVAVAR